MGRRGPKSPTERGADAVLVPGVREPAPDDMEPPAAALWDSIVARLPAEWFNTETRPMLKAFCRHCHYADVFAAEITKQRALVDACEADIVSSKSGPKLMKILAMLRNKLFELHKMHGFETKSALECATKLRLTNQSRYVRDVAGNKARSAPATPVMAWHEWGGNDPTNVKHVAS